MKRILVRRTRQDEVSVWDAVFLHPGADIPTGMVAIEGVREGALEAYGRLVELHIEGIPYDRVVMENGVPLSPVEIRERIRDGEVFFYDHVHDR